MQQKKEYAAVDLFKMFCAILVMLIHTKPFENSFWLDAGVGMITRFAVPFFFTVSGYFLFKRIKENPENKKEILKQYLFRLLRFYLIWFVVFRVVDILLGGSVHSLGYYIKQFFFTTDGSPLWFVEALIWAVIIVFILSEWMKPKTILVIGIVFLLIGYCFSTLLGVTGKWSFIRTLQPIVGYTGIQGGLFFAFPYVAMGASLANQELKPTVKKDLACVALFFVMLGIESLLMVRKFNAPLTFLWISALPMTWYVTRLTLTIPIQSKPAYYIIRKISTLFYVLHVIVFKSLQKAFELVSLSDPMNILLTVLTFIITSCLTYGIFKLSERYAWIRYAM